MTVLQLVLGEDGFVIGLPGRKQVKDDPSELVGGSRDRLGRAQLSSHATIIVTQKGLAPV